MNLSLIGKTALVSGGSQGIGHAIAIELSALGASCILLARDEARLMDAIKGLDHSNGQIHKYYAIDFNQVEALKQLIHEITSKTSIDILINNSGGPAAGLIFEEQPEKFELAFRQHVVCNQILVQAVVPAMKNNKWGRIINIISTSVRIPLDNLGVSNTIRAAVASWSKTMSNELAVYGITVNSLLPGFISTSRLDAVANSFAEKANVSKAEMEDKMRNSVPAKRFGAPAEIAAVAAFLASPAASYVNGVSIPVDGGRTGTI
ncbi:MAG: SDR family oxidoreductase [Chitinophagaceae bacterium]